MRTVVLGACVWLCAAVCSAASPFDGKWAGPFLRPTAGNQDVTITLTTDQGGKVTGTMTLQGVSGESKLSWGFVKVSLDHLPGQGAWPERRRLDGLRRQDPRR